MRVEPPSWLNEAFIASVLQEGEDKEPKVMVLKLDIKPAVASGNNYTSNLFRVKVEFKRAHSTLEESDHLIIKAPIETGAINDMACKMGLFDKEPNIYNYVLPKMYEKMKCDFGPKLYYSPRKNTLVMKDVSSEGYVMSNRLKQLDFSHSKKVFEILAKYHGLSVVCHRDDPEFIETIGKEWMFVEGGFMEQQMKPWYEIACKEVPDSLNKVIKEQSPEDPKLTSVIELILERTPYLWDSMAAMFKSKPKGLNVLNHGDCWTSNMLFKHSESGDVDEMKLIDYQNPRYTSPVADLVYFIWTSADDDVRENHLQELYNIYIENLNTTLEEVGCNERYTLEEMKEDMKKSIGFAIALIIMTFPLMMSDSENVLDMEDVEMEDFNKPEMIKQWLMLYRGKTFNRKLPAVARTFHDWVSSLE